MFSTSIWLLILSNLFSYLSVTAVPPVKPIDSYLSVFTVEPVEPINSNLPVIPSEDNRKDKDKDNRDSYLSVFAFEPINSKDKDNRDMRFRKHYKSECYFFNWGLYELSIRYNGSTKATHKLVYDRTATNTRRQTCWLDYQKQLQEQSDHCSKADCQDEKEDIEICVQEAQKYETYLNALKQVNFCLGYKEYTCRSPYKRMDITTDPIHKAYLEKVLLDIRSCDLVVANCTMAELGPPLEPIPISEVKKQQEEKLDVNQQLGNCLGAGYEDPIYDVGHATKTMEISEGAKRSCTALQGRSLLTSQSIIWLTKRHQGNLDAWTDWLLDM